MSELTTAAVFGKFWPLHVGHLRLIGEAVANADRVIVVVNDGDEDVPVAVRMSWVAESFPSAAVTSAPDLCGHDSDACTPTCSQHYANWVTETIGRVDVVVAGESYGELLAGCLGAASVRLDRTELPAAGREIRADPVGNWDLLSEPSRAWYCRRVVVVGAESTGTTTLAADLAEHLNTLWVPEYGRQFTEDHGIDHAWVTSDFDEIAMRQAAMEDEAARRSGPILVCDTNTLATAIWHERYLGTRSWSVESIAEGRRTHLYVLTGDEIAFVQDGMRDGEHIRSWMTERFREALGDSGVPWLEVHGTPKERLTQVIDALGRHLGENYVFGSPDSRAD